MVFATLLYAEIAAFDKINNVVIQSLIIFSFSYFIFDLILEAHYFRIFYRGVEKTISHRDMKKGLIVTGVINDLLLDLRKNNNLTTKEVRFPFSWRFQTNRYYIIDGDKKSALSIIDDIDQDAIDIRISPGAMKLMNEINSYLRGLGGK